MHYKDKWFCETREDEVDMDNIDFRQRHAICNDEVILIESGFNYMEED